MTNVITRIIDSRNFRNMSADARLLFYDLYYRAGEDRRFSYQNVDAIIDMTNSSRAAFNELYDNHFMILNIDGSYSINRYFGMWDVIKDAGPAEAKKAFPPTVEDVAEYCKEKSVMAMITCYEYAERFVAYYTANGWMLSNGRPMKSWESIIKQWLMRDDKYNAEEATEYAVREFKNKAKEIQEKFEK